MVRKGIFMLAERWYADMMQLLFGGYAEARNFYRERKSPMPDEQELNQELATSNTDAATSTVSGADINAGAAASGSAVVPSPLPIDAALTVEPHTENHFYIVAEESTSGAYTDEATAIAVASQNAVANTDKKYIVFKSDKRVFTPQPQPVVEDA